MKKAVLTLVILGSIFWGSQFLYSLGDKIPEEFIDADVTRDAEWDTLGKIETVTGKDIIDSTELAGAETDPLSVYVDGSTPLTANWDVGAYTITGTQFISDIAGGTAPFVVTSTTEVANLKAATAGNADTVTTNANLTGEVTSTGNAAILDPTCISGKVDTTIADADYVLFWDFTDSTLKKVDAAELTAGGGAFVLDTAVVREDVSGAGDYATDDFVFGSPQLADDGTNDSRMFFDKSKYAFRAGKVASSQWNNTNIGYGSFATGSNNIASDTGAVALGSTNIASGSTSFAVGSGNTASGRYSAAFGYKADAYLRAQFAMALWQISGWSAQYSRLVLTADTTDATPEVMYLGNTSADKVVLPADRAWRVDGNVVATTENSAATATWTIKGLIRRDNANNTTLDWSAVTEDYDGITTDAAVTLTADDANEALNINITGKVATNIRWVATVHLTEVGY